MSNRNSNAGTAADSSTPDEVTMSSQTIAKPLVIGSLPSDDEIWEYLTRTVCGRDMSGLEPYYKPDLILGVKSLIRKLSGNDT